MPRYRDYDNFYEREEYKRATQEDEPVGYYGHSTERFRFSPRGEGYGYTWENYLGDPQRFSPEEDRSGYIEDPYRHDPQIYGEEPYVPAYGYAEGKPATRRELWRVRGPHTGHGPRTYQGYDQRIEEEVCYRLTRHGKLDARKIQVEVKDGEVILEGSVDSRMAKRRAEDTAAWVEGVRDVHNRLKINPA